MEEIKEFAAVSNEIPAFDPNKNYTWKTNAEFVLSGEQFGSILNALRAVLGTQEAQALSIAEQAHSKLQEVFANAVATGIATEIDAPKNSL